MDAYPQTGLEHSGNDGEDENRPGIEATLTRLPKPRSEHLTWQLRLSSRLHPRGGSTSRAGSSGISTTIGYLRAEIEELERISGALRARLVEATSGEGPGIWIRPGVAARDLRECLLLQIRCAGDRRITIDPEDSSKSTWPCSSGGICVA